MSFIYFKTIKYAPYYINLIIIKLTTPSLWELWFLLDPETLHFALSLWPLTLLLLNVSCWLPVLSEFLNVGTGDSTPQGLSSHSKLFPSMLFSTPKVLNTTYE